jgi:type VI secretion system protein ImpC
MPANLSSTGFDMSVRSSQQPARRRGAGECFPLIVLGDFTGRASRGCVEPIDPRRLRRVDMDTFAGVFAQLGASLRLSDAVFPGGALELAFGSMDDWHPDQLLARVPWLADLAGARRLLLSPTTAEQGRAALEACLGGVAIEETETTADRAEPESDEEAFARLLGNPLPEKKAVASSSSLNDFIKQAIAQHVSAEPAAWQAGALAAVEMELHERLRAILHHPDFQELEAAWRGAEMLVSRIVSHEEISLCVLDVSLAELQADLASVPQESALFRLLRDRAPGLLVGNFAFGQAEADLQALAGMAELAAGLSTAFVASASPALVGCDSFAIHPDPDDWTCDLAEDAASVWAALRDSPHAPHVGLTAPRFLMRLPYGRVGHPIDTFPFEEVTAAPVHEAYLWGHASILVACTLIDAIQSGDTDLAEFVGGEIGEMPVHLFIEDGEKVAKSFAEAWLTHRAAERLLRAGVIPVLPVKNSDVIHLDHLCSISAAPTALRVGE